MLFNALLLLIALLAPLSVASFAQSRAALIGIDEVKPGMRGYGLTVFRGTEPSRFEVEVIDVLRNFRPDQDLILVRTDHPELQKAKTVAGMSGSPIYLGGRLAGAYSYGWYFGKEPVAGVTPIASMWAEINRPLIPSIWKTIGVSTQVTAMGPSRAAPKTVHGRLSPSWDTWRAGPLGALRQHAARLGLFEESGARNGPRPVTTPILMGGFESPVVELLEQELGPFGLAALQAGGSSGPRKPTEKPRPVFVDGGAIGVQLIRGDISATAIGTVTHVDGKRLIAFGHPMLNVGQTALPTATARVLHVLASDRQSFKIAETITPLGALVHDRQSAIVVDTGMIPETVPVTVRIRGVQGAPRPQWSVEVAANRVLTPTLTLAAATNALQASCSDRSDVIFTATCRIAIAGHGTLQVQDSGYSAAGPSSHQALSELRVFDLMAAAYANPFENTRVLRVEIDLDVRFGRDLITVVDAMVSSDEVDPGRAVNVQVILRPFGQPDQVRVFPVTIPESAAGEDIELMLQSGNTVQIEQPKAENLDDIIHAIQSGYPSTSLVISTKMPSRGLRTPGQVVRSLPGSAFDALQLTNQSDSAAPFTTYDRTAFPLGQVVTGSALVKLKVRTTPRNR